MRSRQRWQWGGASTTRYPSFSCRAAEPRESLTPKPTSASACNSRLAFNYTGDFPKAIALLNAALRDTPRSERTRSAARFTWRWRASTALSTSIRLRSTTRKRLWNTNGAPVIGAG